jgi:hypothetical protein
MALSIKERQDRYRVTEKGKTTRARCFKEWSQRNRNQRNEYMKAWYHANKDKVKLTARKTRYKQRYGITPEHYDELLAAQNGHCALCNKTPDTERFGRLHVDHDHQTGQVRGLLCNNHNRSLAVMGDNALGLLKALAYVTRPHTPPACT